MTAASSSWRRWVSIDIYTYIVYNIKDMSIGLPEAVSQEAANACKVEPVYWGQTTDPCRHNPDNFRYLVHAFNPHARLGALFIQLVTQDEEAVADGQGDQSIDVFKEPERIDERVSLSMSLIDQDHTATWGVLVLSWLSLNQVLCLLRRLTLAYRIVTETIL